MPPFDLEAISKELNSIDQILDEKKKKGELFANFLLKLHITMQPTKNEYQNFGIMQAIDLINALLYIKTNPPFKVNILNLFM